MAPNVPKCPKLSHILRDARFCPKMPAFPTSPRLAPDPYPLAMFDGLKNLGSLMDLMKNARQVQDRMKSMQDEMGRKTLSADAGAGAVTATVNGRLELVKISIDKSRVNAQDTEMLEDLIVSAVRLAQDKAADMMRQEMSRAAAEMGLPPGMLP